MLKQPRSVLPKSGATRALSLISGEKRGARRPPYVMVVESLSGYLSLHCRALGLVALAPVAPLAVDRAVQPLLALRAPLVLHGLTLRARAE